MEEHRTASPAGPGAQERARSADLSHAADMVYISAGSFVMGSPASEVEALLRYYTGVPRDLFVNEIGEHEVALNGFFIDRYAVSNAQFRRFIAAGGYERQEWWSSAGWRWRLATRRISPRFWPREELALETHPVVGISWYEADAYARSAGKRLPSEAEWERAARGVDARRYPWGNNFELGRCNSADLWLQREIRDYRDWYAHFFVLRPWRTRTLTTPVDSFPGGASPQGVLNMGGNVWEWCADWYAEDYYARSPRENPRGAGDGSEKLCRGGSFGYFGWSVRTTDRGHHPPDHYALGLGLRCALDAPA